MKKYNIIKTPMQKLIEQLDEKIEHINEVIKTQDEVGVYMYTGLLAGFMESKLLAETYINTNE